MSQIGNITLGTTMVHEVPRGSTRTSEDGVTLSDDPTTLDAATDRFIRDQLLDPFVPSGRDIIAVPEATADGHDLELVPRLVVELLANDSKLPEHSQAIAEHLFASQVGAASAGIFLASVGDAVHVGRCVILMKAEHQEGVRLQQRNANGHVVFEVEHIKELIVGQNSKVYKIAALWVDDKGEVVGKMVDRQNGVAYADYFLSRFLGMRLRHQAEKLTKDLLEAATMHINTTVHADKRTRYTRALVALMESPTDNINTTQFIRTSIDPEDRDAFEAALPSEVRATFRKDVTLVKAQIGGIAFDLHDGEVHVRATAGAVDNGVIEVNAADQVVVIKGVPDNIAVARPPKKQS